MLLVFIDKDKFIWNSNTTGDIFHDTHAVKRSRKIAMLVLPSISNINPSSGLHRLLFFFQRL